MYRTILFFSHLSIPIAIVIGSIIGGLLGSGIGALYFNIHMQRSFRERLHPQRNPFLTPTNLLLFRVWIVISTFLFIGFALFYLGNAGWGVTLLAFFLSSVSATLFLFIIIFFTEKLMKIH